MTNRQIFIEYLQTEAAKSLADLSYNSTSTTMNVLLTRRSHLTQKLYSALDEVETTYSDFYPLLCQQKAKLSWAMIQQIPPKLRIILHHLRVIMVLLVSIDHASDYVIEYVETDY